MGKGLWKWQAEEIKFAFWGKWKNILLMLWCKPNLTCTPLDIFVYALQLITTSKKVKKKHKHHYIIVLFYCTITTNPITYSVLHAPRWRVPLPPSIPPKPLRAQNAFVRHRLLAPAPNPALPCRWRNFKPPALFSLLHLNPPLGKNFMQPISSN